MTYPITPDPAIHQVPSGTGQQKSLFTPQQLEAWAEQLPLAMTKDLVDAVLTALGAPQSEITLANDGLDAMAATIKDWLNPTAANAQAAYTTLDTLFLALGLPAPTAEAFASWLSGVSQTANSSQTLATTALVTSSQGLTNWTGLLAALEQGNVQELTTWLTTAFTNAETAVNNWIATLESQGLADIEAFVTWINGFIDNPTFSALLTALFGSDAIGYITTVEQDIINFATNALSGGDAPTSSNSPAAALLDGLSTIPHTNVVIPPSPGSGAITWDANYSGTPFTGPVTSLVAVNYNHTCAATANYLILRLGFYSTYTPIVSVFYNGVSMLLLASERGPDLNTYLQIYGLPNPATGTHSVGVDLYSPLGSAIDSIVVESDSYIGVGSVGTATVSSGGDSNPSVSAVSATGDYVVQAFFGSDSFGSTLSSYQVGGVTTTPKYNSGNLNPSSGPDVCLVAGDAAGASTVSFTATAADTTANRWVAGAVNLVPLPASVIGSVFRAANTSTSTVSANSGNSYFPNSFFNSTTGQPGSTDLTYAPGTLNTVTITHAGTYSVTIAVLLVSTFNSQFLGLNLIQTPSGGSPMIKRGDTPLISNPSFNTNVVTSHTFQVYCNAGDTLAPGYYCSTSGSAFTGTADGLSTYFEVSLNNRGLHS